MSYSCRLLVYFALAILCGYSGDIRCETFETIERASVNQVGMAMSLYSRMRNGEAPSNWEQIRTIYNIELVNNNLARRKRAPLNERYRFVTQKISTLDERGLVLLVRSIPLERIEIDERGEEKRVRWRYMVTRGKDGIISATRVPEEEVQAIFQKAGVALPAPKPGEPAVETEDAPAPYDQPEQPSTTPMATPPIKHAVTPAPRLSVPATPAPPTVAVAKTPSRWPWIGVGILVLIVGWFVWKRRG